MSKINGILIGLLTILVVNLVSCADDDLAQALQEGDMQIMNTPLEVTKPGGLIQQADGTWKTQNCRVPIVGPGRIVNDVNSSTVGLISAGNNTLGRIVDTDLTNQCNIQPAAVGVDVASPIVSVKDLYHIYAAGQKVGFVYKDNGQKGSLLELELLKGMTLTTYLNGKEQEKFRTATGTGDKEVLHLDLLTVNSKDGKADRVIAMNTTKPFNEVHLSLTSVEVSAGKSIAIKYAFVGENPMIKATTDEPFWGANKPSINYTDPGLGKLALTDISEKEGNKIIDSDLENYGEISSKILGLLGATHRATVNFNREIAAGTEVGYNYSAGKLLDLSLFGQDFPRLHTYNEANDKVESLNTGEFSTVNVGLLSGTKQGFISMVTSEPCSQLQIVRPTGGVLLPGLLELSTLHVYYAYIRQGVQTDPVNSFTFGNDTTYEFSYKLPMVGANQGTVVYTLLSTPYGSTATIENGVLMGMDKEGAYRIQAFYTAPDGRQVSHIATIFHKTNQAQKQSIFITAKNHGAYASEALNSPSDFCLLCLFNGTNNLNNVVDNSEKNYALTYRLASVLGWQPIASFKLNKPVVPQNEESLRTGFIVQAQSKLLDLSALNLYKIRLYKGNQLVGDNTADDKANVKLGLLGFDRSKVRLSVETKQAFDRIELWQKGVANVLNSLRIFHLFYEPASYHETAVGGGCMEMLTNLKDNLQIDYERSEFDAGLASAANSIKNMEYLLDASAETSTSIGGLLSASGHKLSLKFNTQKGNQTVGLILGGVKNLADIKVGQVGVLKVFNEKNEEVGKKVDVGVADIVALSEGGRVYIEVTAEKNFNRIEYTTAGIDVLQNAHIAGVYIRPDSDGNGIPDCADTKSETGGLEIDGNDFHTCYGNPLNLPLRSAAPTLKEVNLYCFNEDTKSSLRCKGTIEGTQLVVPAKALPVGRYLLYIYSADGEILFANDIKATIHPQTTTWRANAKNTDWNEWNNWTNGSPWFCTNVILPGNAAHYPELNNKAVNHCKNIHFESGAELMGSEFLTIAEKVFVDLRLQGGRYYLLSAPLQEMVTGDMFIAPGTTWGIDKYFTPLSAETYKESRNRPIVYQHFWNGTALEHPETGNPTDVGTAQWSKDFNAVNTHYDQAQGFLLRPGKATDRNTYTFRFPKMHEKYQYFRSDGTLTEKFQQVQRTNTNIGKFAAIPSATGTSFTLKNTKASGMVFLMGNPFMTHIDVDRFVKGNSNVVEVRVCRNGSFDPNRSIDVQTVSSKMRSGLLIAPMEAFFVVTTTASQELKVTLNSSMLRQKHPYTQTQRR